MLFTFTVAQLSRLDRLVLRTRIRRFITSKSVSIVLYYFKFEQLCRNDVENSHVRILNETKNYFLYTIDEAFSRPKIRVP